MSRHVNSRRDFLKTTAGAAAAGSIGAGGACFRRTHSRRRKLDAGEGRQAARAALEALRAGRRGHVDGEHQEVHREDRRRGARRQRGLGGRAAQGGGGGQRRQRPGHHHLDLRGCAPVSGQARRRDRRLPTTSAASTAAGTTCARSTAPRRASGSRCRWAAPATPSSTASAR